MRKIISLILIGLGGFLLVAGLLTTVWAPGAAKKAPADTDSTTRLSGPAAVVPTGATDVEVRAVSVTKADSDKSDGDVVVYANYTCLVLDNPGPDCGVEGTGDDADPNVISVGTPSIFATDRTTGVAVNGGGYLPPGTPETQGLVNKFPFDTEKTDYEFWDGVLRDTVTAAYEGTDTVDGLATYRFRYVVENQPAEIAKEVQGTYSMDKTMWVEPTTGQIVDQTQHDVRSLDGKPLLDVALSFTDDQVKVNVDEAEANVSSLNLLTKTVPVVGWVGGLLLLGLGVLLLVLDRRGKDRDARATSKPAHA